MNHAFLTCSGAKKWTVCPKSPHLEKLIPDQEREYATEGTKMHAYAEHILTEKREEFEEELNAAQKEQVFDYVNYIKNILSDDDYILLVEHKYDMSKYIPGGFGTADATIIKTVWVEGLPETQVHICDLKTGRGVKVKDDLQLKCYLLGAYEEFKDKGYFMEPIKFYTHIIQPTLNNYVCKEYSLRTVLDFGDYLKRRAEIALDEDSYCVAGEHCREGFCKARYDCQTYKNYIGDIREYKLLPYDELDLDTIKYVLDKGSDIINWIKGVTEEARKNLINGSSIEGFTLKTGRKTRYFSSEVLPELLKMGYDEELLFETKLVSPSKLETLLTREEFNKIKHLISIKEGEPKIVKREGTEKTRTKNQK